MPKIKNPILFTKYFGIDPQTLKEMGVLNPILNVDAKLFIDPLILEKSKHIEFSINSVKSYRGYFENIIKLLEVTDTLDSVPGRQVYRLLKFDEMKGSCIGYGKNSINGNAFGPVLINKMIKTAREIVHLGIKDPDLFLLLPLIEEKIGPDRISDMTSQIIIKDIIEFNKRVYAQLEIPLEEFIIHREKGYFPINPCQAKKIPIVLLPKDILRNLPTISDKSEIESATLFNTELRDKINNYIGEIWRAKSKADKSKIRNNALKSKEAISSLLELMGHINSKEYNYKEDPQGIFIWRNLLETIPKEYPLDIKIDSQLSLDKVFEIVKIIIGQFKLLIEDKGLNKELWLRGKPRPEKSAQMIFFAVAESYCKANNLDITPEAETGNGPVDFKFSTGFNSRVLVEIKLSTHSKLVDGYVKQIETYKKSQETMKAVYLVLDVGQLKKKEERLYKTRNEFQSKKYPISDLLFIDGKKYPSASKR